MRVLSLITMCLPWLTILNLLFPKPGQPEDDLYREVSARLRWNFDLAHLRTL